MLEGPIQASAVSLSSIIEMLSDAAVGVSALVVAVTAIWGLNTWRKRARAEAAHRLLGLAKRLASEIQQTRLSITYSGESSGRHREDNENQKQTRYLDERYARLSRLAIPSTTLKQLYEAAWNADALLGLKLTPYVSAYGKVLQEIAIAIEKLYQVDSAGEPARDMVAQEESMARAMVYGQEPEDDPVLASLTEAQDALETALRRHI